VLDTDRREATPLVLNVTEPVVFAVVEVTVILVGLSMLVIVVIPPKAPVPIVFVTLIPTTKPTVEESPVIGVVFAVDKIVPVIVPVDTPVFSLMFGRGFGPQPKAR
jgi:hypothetical protein